MGGMNNMRYKKKTRKKVIAGFELFILVLSVFAFSFILYDSSKLVGSVSAQSLSCCTSGSNGICQDILSSESASCSGDLISNVRCQDSSECELGCCFDPEEGFCMERSPKWKCEQDGGEWSSDENCNLAKCRKGCCVLGSNTAFVTSTRCDKLSQDGNLVLDFKSEIRTEASCLILSSLSEMGACVRVVGGEEVCSFTSRQECSGEFYKDYLCSNDELNNSCERQAYTGCVEGKDEVYWFDSCGNQENVYSSDKDVSWNKGVVLNKFLSCNVDSGNILNKDCGNCDFALGSRCVVAGAVKPSYGDYICGNMNCPNAIDSNGKKTDRKNGESWCVYESATGQGQDVVGSRNYRYSCVNGEVIQEACQDFRNEVCYQENLNKNGDVFSSAVCRINMWQECLQGNCANQDCYSKTIQLSDDKPPINLCLPKHAPGFDVKDNGDVASKICSQASDTCTVVYVKRLFSGWECVYNCECEDASYAQQMNEWCTSLGDCGFKKNVVGKATKSYSLIGETPDVSTPIGDVRWNGVVPSQGSAASRMMRQQSGGGVGNENEEGYEPDDDSGELAMWVGGVAGAGGLAIAGLATTTTYSFLGMAVSQGFAQGAANWGLGSLVKATPTMWGGVANALGGIAIGAAIAGVANMIFDLQGDAAIATTVVGVAVGGTSAVIAGAGGAGFWSVTGTVALWAGIAVAITVLIMKLMKIGETKEKTISFTCQAWQPPVGGGDCDKCDDGLGCSKYKCQSLGTACSFLNEGTGNELCVASKNDGKQPDVDFNIDINNGEENASNLYEKTSSGVRITNMQGGCIQEFTRTNVSFTTIKPTQCKYDVFPSASYEQMPNQFVGDNLFRYNHDMQFSLPSVDAIANQFNITRGEVLEIYGNFKLYIRCQDEHGNFNVNPVSVEMCVSEGPDLTPPRINKIIPSSEGYVKRDVDSKEINLFVNEQAECKWSLEDKEYNEMENSFECKTSLLDETGLGWPCVGNVSISGSENKYYIRCKDKPWLASSDETDELKRYANEESYEYVLRKAESEFIIERTAPGGLIESASVPTSVELKVKTSGGAGDAECYYSFDSVNCDDSGGSGAGSGTGGCNWILFRDTYSQYHNQIFNLISGSYNINLKCIDEAGDKAYSSAEFEIKLDDAPPIITRVINQGGGIRLITNEEADCYTSIDERLGCSYSVENASFIGSGFEHSLSGERTNYIKCRDKFGNMPSGCSIIIRAVNEENL